MLHEGTLVSLTENIIAYCDGDFIREYSRLVKQQNIHLYRICITQELERLKGEPLLQKRNLLFLPRPGTVLEIRVPGEAARAVGKGTLT